LKTIKGWYPPLEMRMPETKEIYSMTDPRYPEIEVVLDLGGPDGNAFAVIGHTVKALRSYGVDASLIKQYQEECMSGDYDNLLNVTSCWVTFLHN
jgi:hypothetical protein